MQMKKNEWKRRQKGSKDERTNERKVIWGLGNNTRSFLSFSLARFSFSFPFSACARQKRKSVRNKKKRRKRASNILSIFGSGIFHSYFPASILLFIIAQASFGRSAKRNIKKEAKESKKNERQPDPPCPQDIFRITFLSFLFSFPAAARERMKRQEKRLWMKRSLGGRESFFPLFFLFAHHSFPHPSLI